MTTFDCAILIIIGLLGLFQYSKDENGEPNVGAILIFQTLLVLGAAGLSCIFLFNS
jgi:hypothetical protein